MKTLKYMITNYDMIILFLAYLGSMIAGTNGRNIGVVYATRAYGFATVNEAKGASNIAQVVGGIV